MIQGVYMGENPLGASGHFVTSPEIRNVFLSPKNFHHPYCVMYERIIIKENQSNYHIYSILFLIAAEKI